MTAHLKKNFIEKRRNIRVTLCEFLSHLLIVIVLTLGYGLSKVSLMPETEYATIDVQVPPSFYSGTPPQVSIG